MNALWNKKTLERPANNIWIADRDAIDLKDFSANLESAIKDLESQNTLHTEAAILSRLIYRMKSKFRADKGLKNMEKVNRALLNYLEIKLDKDYNDLRRYIEVDESVVNLPTKQMLQYLLVRTQGFAKLMSRIESVARQAAEFFRVRISIGHAWTVSVIAYAVVSRVWFLARYLLKRCCQWYNGVRKHVDDFQTVGPAWLPKDYELPEDLKAWLDLPWIDLASDSVPLRDDGKETIFGLIKANDEDTCDGGVNSEVEEEIEEKEDEEEEEEEEEKRDEEEEKSKPIVDGSDNASLIKTGKRISSRLRYGVSHFSDDVGTSIDREAYAAGGKLVAEEEGGPKEGEKFVEGNKISANLVDVETTKKRRIGKSKPPTTGDGDASPIPTKMRKNNDSEETSQTRVVKILKSQKDRRTTFGTSEDSAVVKRVELKTGKVKKTRGESTTSSCTSECDKLSKIGDIKTRNDLAAFLSKDSHPSLDKLQWNMLMNSIKKFVVKLDKCRGVSDEKRANSVLKKINREINNWIK